jgi:HAMP domain-containing protein
VPLPLSTPFFLNHLRMSPTFRAPGSPGYRPGPIAADAARSRSRVAGWGDRPVKTKVLAARSAALAPSREKTQEYLDGIPEITKRFENAAELQGRRRDGRAGAARRRGGRCVRRLHPADGHDPRPSCPCQGHSGYITANDASALPLVQPAQADIETLRDSEATDAATAAAAAQAEYASQRTTAIVILVVGIAVPVSLGLVLASGIARGVRRLRRMAEALAAGDLTCSAGLTTRDELGRMGAALDTAVGELRSVVSSAEETSAQAGVVSGAEQMGASIREIASNAAEASEVAARAVWAAEQAKATEDIAQISDRQTTMAGAVEEQTATTGEMSRSVQEAAGGTTEIATNITGVSKAAAGSTTQALGQTRIAVDELSRMASELRTAVGRFTY